MDPGESTLLFRGIPAGSKFTAAEKRDLAAFVASATEQIAGGRALNCLITNDAALRRLNASFLGKDYATDVLSFPSHESAEIGEMAISVQRAEEQAIEFGHSRLDEIRLLILHGLLHLVGFDHETDRGEMAREEKRWRAVFGLPATVIARAHRKRA